MGNKNTVYAVIGLVSVFVLFLFVWNKYQVQVQERPNSPIKLPPQISGVCGIQNCHGLEITCGPNVPEACDMMYASGDICRQFASCQTTSGQCGLTKTPKFDTCKSCVEKCVQDFKEDSIKLSQCEGSCAN